MLRIARRKDDEMKIYFGIAMGASLGRGKRNAKLCHQILLSYFYTLPARPIECKATRQLLRWVEKKALFEE